MYRSDSPLEFGNLSHEKPDLITVEFGDLGDPVDVSDEVFRRAQEGTERSLALRRCDSEGSGLTCRRSFNEFQHVIQAHVVQVGHPTKYVGTLEDASAERIGDLLGE
jgi:hypothetical protein